MTVQNIGPLISVIMPLYNCEKYILQAVESVVAQTYKNWELIIVDDCSTDTSLDLVQKYVSDSRVKLIASSLNEGAARARTIALGKVTGSYVAYMDSDDVWLPNKLERQLKYMERTGTAMCFTAYETIQEDGEHKNYVWVPERIDYKGFLKNTITCSHTIMLDLNRVSIEWLMAPSECIDYDYPEDLDTWLRVLSHGGMGCGLNEILAKYRKHPSSRSADKRKAVSRTWNQYRKREGLSVPYSAYCLFWQLFHAVLKRI